MSFAVRNSERRDISGIVALQAICFPPPFPQELLWKEEDLLHHLEIFPDGQYMAEKGDVVIGSSSSLLISPDKWISHTDWDDLTGGLSLAGHDPNGCLLYGADISVHPDWRMQGVGQALYRARFDLVRSLKLTAYVTTCRIPGFLDSGFHDPAEYARLVSQGKLNDRTMSPLLKMGLTYGGVHRGSMEDRESGNAAAILEWRP